MKPLVFLFAFFCFGIVFGQGGCILVNGSNSLSKTSSNAACDQSSNYIPSMLHINATPIKTLRVNVHFILRSDSTGNWRETDDGRGNTFYTGYEMSRQFLMNVNQAYANLYQTTIPARDINNNPYYPSVIPSRIQFELTGQPGEDPNKKGVYFHYSDQYYTLPGCGTMPLHFYVGKDSIVGA